MFVLIFSTVFFFLVFVFMFDVIFDYDTLDTRQVILCILSAFMLSLIMVGISLVSIYIINETHFMKVLN